MYDTIDLLHVAYPIYSEGNIALSNLYIDSSTNLQCIKAWVGENTYDIIRLQNNSWGFFQESKNKSKHLTTSPLLTAKLEATTKDILSFVKKIDKNFMSSARLSFVMISNKERFLIIPWSRELQARIRTLETVNMFRYCSSNTVNILMPIQGVKEISLASLSNNVIENEKNLKTLILYSSGFVLTSEVYKIFGKPTFIKVNITNEKKEDMLELDSEEKGEFLVSMPSMDTVSVQIMDFFNNNIT